MRHRAAVGISEQINASHPNPPIFRTTVRRKDNTRLIPLAAATIYGAWRVTRAVIESLRHLPRNEDMIFY